MQKKKIIGRSRVFSGYSRDIGLFTIHALTIRMSGGDVTLPSELHEMLRSNGDLPMLSFEGTKHASQDGVRRPST